ncbi:MAG TPA: glutathione S-transferase family protein [Candidatus Binatia bacterium]|nr:glutathione S-transferase family protein [Candidatus Binatia bacterium]
MARQEAHVVTLYQFEISPFCDKVRRILDYKGVAYEVREISMQEAVTKVRKVNKVGKLPAIEHEGRCLGDSTEIAYYLEERFPSPSIFPADAREKGMVHVFEDWADESLYFYEMFLRFTLGHNAEKWVPILCANDSDIVRRAGRFIIPRHMKAILVKQGLGRKSRKQVLTDVRRHFQHLSGLLEGRTWLVGDSLTLADIAVFAQLACVCGAKEGAAMRGEHPVVDEWMKRVDAATAPRAPRSERAADAAGEHKAPRHARGAA